MKKFYRLSLSLLALAFNISNGSEMEFWYRSGANNASTKYSNIDQIDGTNIGNLSKAWVFHSGYIEVLETVQTNPVFTGHHLITTSLDGRVNALDPGNGKLLWKRYLPPPAGRRGVTYQDGKIYVPTGAGVHMLDAANGATLKVYGSELSTLPPVVTNDLVLTANTTAGLFAYKRSTGETIWSLNLRKDGVLARLWSGFSYDAKSNLAFVVTSNTGFLNSDSHHSGGYANSVLAINATTGKLAWQFQEIKNDLWDLDMVGPPMVASLKIAGIPTECVIAVSKSGNTIILNRRSGKLLNKAISKFVNGQPYLEILSPQPFSNNVLTQEDITDLSPQKTLYVQHKIRNASLEQYRETSAEHPIAMFGLHGGAEWPGAAIDPHNGIMVVPSNRYPWIVRTTMFNASNINPVDFLDKDPIYNSKCAGCHQSNLSGLESQTEVQGDSYIPPLIGVSTKLNAALLFSPKQFSDTHQYAWEQLQSYLLLKSWNPHNENYWFIKITRKIGRLFNFSDQNIDRFIKSIFGFLNIRPYSFDEVTEKELLGIYERLKEIDAQIIAKDGLKKTFFWQLLLDQDKLPGSKPPWGYLTAIDLNTGNRKWQIPFGEERDQKSGKSHLGARNFGGVMLTKTKLVFANGTTDEFARAYDQNNGQELWKDKLPFAGSAPPMTYFFQGCQYVLFTATGGKFIGFQSLGDATVAYKLNSCHGN